MNTLSSIIGFLAALVAGWVALLLQGYDATLSYIALIDYTILNENALTSVLTKTAILILTGLSAAIGFNSGVINLGQVGQVVAGAIAVTAVGIAINLHIFIMVPLLLVVGCISGAMLACIAAVFKTKYGMNEFISTIMLNLLLSLFTMWIISGPLKEPGSALPTTTQITKNGFLPSFGVVGMDIILVGVIFVICYFFYNYSETGYEMRMHGYNETFSRIGGCKNKISFYTAMLLGGGLAGLGGALLIMSGEQHRFLQKIESDYGWDGVMLAVIAGKNLKAIPFYALFFAIIQGGAIGMQLETDVPDVFNKILQGLILIFVIVCRELFIKGLTYIKTNKNIRKITKSDVTTVNFQ